MCETSIKRGESVNIPVEIERKFVIEMPDLAVISALEGYSSSEILQTYLETSKHLTHRVRARAIAGGAVYTETKKIRIDKMSVYEDERVISADEYSALAKTAAPGTVTIRKTRHSFEYLGNVIEIDVYPEWQRSCILEVELSSREQKVELPDFITVVAEVTGDKKYSNASMSREFPKELI